MVPEVEGVLLTLSEPQETETTPAEPEPAAEAPAGTKLNISMKTKTVDISIESFLFMGILLPSVLRAIEKPLWAQCNINYRLFVGPNCGNSAPRAIFKAGDCRASPDYNTVKHAPLPHCRSENSAGLRGGKAPRAQRFVKAYISSGTAAQAAANSKRRASYLIQ